MTPQQFAKLFPNLPFALRYVERGARKDRRFVWFAKFTSEFFTTDSDRLVDDVGAYGGTFGDTPEEALEALVELHTNELREDVQRARARALEAETVLGTFLMQREGALK